MLHGIKLFTLTGFEHSSEPNKQICPFQFMFQHKFG
ncbi:Uncharacterised protein [Mycobacteroides abscessus subsp. abscessus]|nr:Uncharacterised protein [Mycobacteroides abscessus subsp. abscessus]